MTSKTRVNAEYLKIWRKLEEYSSEECEREE